MSLRKATIAEVYSRKTVGLQRRAGASGLGSNRERLDSWKRIAVYLNREVRTVQRWEKREDLPVHRNMSGKLVSVYAFGREIDAWLTQQGFDLKKNKLDAWLRRPRRNPKQRPC